jgi:hypothetical protein
MGRKKSGARYKRGALAGVVAGVVMALAYILVDLLSQRSAMGADGGRFMYFLARIGAGVLIGVVWGLFYAAIEERVWGVSFLKGIVFGAAVWLLGGLPTALNIYLADKSQGLWAFGGLGVSIVGGIAVSLVYGRVGYDDTKREPVKVTATITGGEKAEEPDRDMLPPPDGA